MPLWGRKKNDDIGGGDQPRAKHRECDCEVLQVKNEWSTICQCRNWFTSDNPKDKLCSECIAGLHSWNRR